MNLSQLPTTADDITKAVQDEYKADTDFEFNAAEYAEIAAGTPVISVLTTHNGYRTHPIDVNVTYAVQTENFGMIFFDNYVTKKLKKYSSKVSAGTYAKRWLKAVGFSPSVEVVYEHNDRLPGGVL